MNRVIVVVLGLKLNLAIYLRHVLIVHPILVMRLERLIKNLKVTRLID